jgi:hypothetical protein
MKIVQPRAPLDPSKIFRKYFDIHRKSEILDSVTKALISLENDVSIPKKESKTAKKRRYKRVVRESPSKSNGAKQRSRPLYFINQLGQITLDEDKTNPDQLVLVLKRQFFFIDRTIITHEYSISQLFQALKSLSNLF